MKCQSINFFLLFLLLFSASYSQEAENIYNNYSKVGFFIQPAVAHGFEVQSGSDPRLSFNNTLSYQLGLFYNFYQKKEFNLKTGVSLKTLHTTFNVDYQNIDTGYNYSNDLSNTNLSVDLVFSEIIRAEYILPVSSDFNLTVNLGGSLDIRPVSQNDQINITVYNVNTQSYEKLLSIDSFSKQVTSSIDFSLGFNYKSRFGLFQMDFFYNNQLFSYPKSGVYTFYSESSIIKQGYYNVKGNYYGITITFVPLNSKNLYIF